jgi:hypothetical protein
MSLGNFKRLLWLTAVKLATQTSSVCVYTLHEPHRKSCLKSVDAAAYRLRVVEFIVYTDAVAYLASLSPQSVSIKMGSRLLLMRLMMTMMPLIRRLPLPRSNSRMRRQKLSPVATCRHLSKDARMRESLCGVSSSSRPVLDSCRDWRQSHTGSSSCQALYVPRTVVTRGAMSLVSPEQRIIYSAGEWRGGCRIDGRPW